MKLKDIVPYCLNAKNGIFEKKYYWIINGLTYTIDSLETKGSDFTDGLFNYEQHFDSVNYIYLSRYNFINPNETQASDIMYCTTSKNTCNILLLLLK